MKTLKHLFWKLVIVIISITSIACKKEKGNETKPINSEIKLTVIEYGSNAPLKNVAVGLLKRTPGSLLGSASYSIVQTANTDNNGFVSFGHYSDWDQLYIDVQHPDYYDISTLSATQLAKDGYLVKLSGVSYVSVRFFNTHHKNKPKTILAYGFDPYRGGGGHPAEITIHDTLFQTFLIPALHITNVKYLLFDNWEKRQSGLYYLDTLIPFTTAPTNDTIYLSIYY